MKSLTLEFNISEDGSSKSRPLLECDVDEYGNVKMIYLNGMPMKRKFIDPNEFVELLVGQSFLLDRAVEHYSQDREPDGMSLAKARAENEMLEKDIA